VMVDLGRAQQRLRRNASPVEADAAQMLALHDCRLESELRRPDGGNISARSRTDHQYVERSISHLPFDPVKLRLRPRCTMSNIDDIAAPQSCGTACPAMRTAPRNCLSR